MVYTSCVCVCVCLHICVYCSYITSLHQSNTTMSYSLGGNIGRVKSLTIQPTSAPSTLQVSWSKPGIIKLLKLRSETYHLTLNSTQGIHTFNVSDSVKILSGVVDKAYYSKTIISLLATPLTDEYCRLISSGIQAIFSSRLYMIKLILTSLSFHLL